MTRCSSPGEVPSENRDRQDTGDPRDRVVDARRDAGPLRRERVHDGRGQRRNEERGAAFAAQMYFLMERQRRLREAAIEETPGAVVADFLIEKDKVFAYLNLDNEELKLYERYYESFSANLPKPDLVIYLQATPEVLQARIARKGAQAESRISQEYLTEVVRAYEHFFFHYTASDLLVVNTSEIDFVARNDDLQQLLRRIQEPVKGTQYFLPLTQE